MIVDELLHSLRRDRDLAWRCLASVGILNFRFQHYPKANVLGPLDESLRIVNAFHQQKDAIQADRRFTTEGKRDALKTVADAALASITKWHEPRLAGLDADLGTQRTALLPQSSEKPDARRIDFLLSHLRDKTPLEIATFYGSATDEERVLMEAAAASVGRIPMKGPNGLEWQPLLQPESVNESVIARATAKNPAGVAKLRELEEIRAMQVTVAHLAAAEIQEALAG